MAKYEEMRAIARKAIAEELRSAKKKLSKLKKHIREIEADIKKREYRQELFRDYPGVPEPWIVPSKICTGLPEAPGIYFLWNGDEVEYVGKSVKLNARLKLGYHDYLDKHHRISFILCDEDKLDFTECFYIGILRPEFNFRITRIRARIKIENAKEAA